MIADKRIDSLDVCLSPIKSKTISRKEKKKKTMSFLQFAIFSAFLFTSSAASGVCYPPYGCYPLDPPWWSISRPFPVTPKPPEVINTRFLLFTRSSPDEETELVTNKTGILLLSDFDGDKYTRIIVHGFLHSGFEPWVTQMKKSLLNVEDSNIIIVQWGEGSRLPYMQATANSRVVGDQLAHLIAFLNRSGENPLSKIHIIGQGMGSHIAGYAGKKVKIGRISGLDPAKPYFDGSEPSIRLNKADADFVDVIHTDGSSLLALGFGMDIPLGHVDYYPNGGKNQPACGDLIDRIVGSIWDVVKINLIGAQQALACSHRRAIELYIDSITSKCPYGAFPCASEDAFNSGKCVSCGAGGKGCSRMGFYSNKFTARGSMYLSTNGRLPFCNYHYSIKLMTSQKQTAAVGEIYLSLRGQSGLTSFIRINNDSLKIGPRNNFTMSTTASVPIGDIVGVEVKFTDKGWVWKNSLSISKVIVSFLDSNLTSHTKTFCGYDVEVPHGQSVILKPSTFC